MSFVVFIAVSAATDPAAHAIAVAADTRAARNSFVPCIVFPPTLERAVQLYVKRASGLFPNFAGGGAIRQSNLRTAVSQKRRRSPPLPRGCRSILACDRRKLRNQLIPRD